MLTVTGGRLPTALKTSRLINDLAGDHGKIAAMLVTCLPGADRRNVLEALRDVRTSLANVRAGSGPSASEWLLKYLGWANEAERLLRSQVSRGDIARLIFTPGYERLLSGGFGRLVSSTGAADRVLMGFLSIVLDEQLAAMDEALEAFTQQMNKWTGLEAFLIPDTTVFIHHPQKLEELDFGAELGTPGAPVRILVPIAVVDELDGLKQSKDRQVRWRARHTLQIIDDVFSHGVEPASLRKDDSSAPIFELMFDPLGHNRLPITDDEIIDRALAMQPLAARPITLLTFDTGQSTRARVAGLRVVKLREPIDEPAST